MTPPPLTPSSPADASAAAPLGPVEPADDVNGDIDIDQKLTMTEAIEDDSGEILLEPGPDGELHVIDHLASGTGETGGASLDDPTEDESSRSSAPLTVVPEAQLAHETERAPVMRRPALEPQPSSPALSPAWLVVQSGTDRGRRFALRSGRTSVGRGVDNDVVLTDIAVSRKHLTIEFDGASYFLNDLGSGNGTMVNNRDEDGSFRLGHGDKLELGNTVLVFECTAAGTAAAGARQVVRRAGRRRAEHASRGASRPAAWPGTPAGTAPPPAAASSRCRSSRRRRCRGPVRARPRWRRRWLPAGQGPSGRARRAAAARRAAGARRGPGTRRSRSAAVRRSAARFRAARRRRSTRRARTGPAARRRRGAAGRRRWLRRRPRRRARSRPRRPSRWPIATCRRR